MDNLTKLKELIKVAQDGVTKEEFTTNFRIIIDLVKKLKEEHKESLDSIDTKYLLKIEELLGNLRSESWSVLEKTQKEVMDYCKSEMSKMSKEIKDKIESIEDGEDGEDADEEKCAEMAVEKLKPLIPKIEDIEKDLPKLGTEIRNSLELLQGEERLDASAIKGLEEKFQELERRINSKSVMGGGGVGKHNVEVYDLSDSLNGVTKTFNLPAMWKLLKVESTSTPIVFRKGIDFTSTNTSVTFTDQIDAATTLAAGQTVLLTYQV